MANRGKVDPVQLRAALSAVDNWLHDRAVAPLRADIAAAVRLSARTLAAHAPGSAVEVRIPPFVAVQCVAGPRHTRGTPPNVVETDPRTWLLLVTGLLDFDTAVASGVVSASGSRTTEIGHLLPLAAR